MTEPTRFTAFVTKYSIASGKIAEVQVEDCFKISSDMVKTRKNGLQFFHRNDWHRTRAAAVERAEKMRLAKIKSLKLQLVRLEKLRFK